MKFKEVKGVLLALSLVVVAPFTTPAAVITAKAAETSEETAAEENVEDPENEGVQEEKTVPAAGLAADEEVGVNEGEKENEETQYTGEDNQSVEETNEEELNEEELKEEIIKEETIKESEDTETTPEDEDRIPEDEKEPAAEGTGAQDPEIDAAADAEVPEELDEVNEEPAAEENSEEAAGNTGQTETSETEYAADTEGTEDTTDTAVTTGTAVTTDTADTSDKTTSDPELIDPSVPEGTVVDADQVTDLNALKKEAASVASTKTDGVIYYDYANGRYIDMKGLPTTYKIPVPKGVKNVRFDDYDSLSLTVDADGTVHPYGEGGTDFYAEDGIYEVTVTGWIGDNYDQYKKTYKIKVVDYMTKKYNEKVAGIASTLKGKTQTQTLKNIAEYVAYNYKYTADNSSKVELVYKGSSSCVGTAGLVVDLCEELGIEAYGRPDYGAAGYGHTNVIAKADGKYYVVDSSYDSSAKYYDFYEEKDGLLLLNDNTQLIQYDAFDVNPVLPEGIIKIRHTFENWTKYVFAHNYAYPVESVTIPSTVTDIDPVAFERSEKLKNIKVSKNNKTYKDVNGALYTKDGKILVRFPGSRSEYTVADKTKTIGERAFSWIGSIGRLVLPDSLVEFGKQAFYQSSGIRDVFVPASVTKIADDSFENACFMRIIAPAGSYMEKYYKKNKSKFKDSVTFITLEEYKKSTGSDTHTDPAGQGGTTKSGWVTEQGKKRYYVNGTPVKSTWKTISGKKYYFDKNGYAVTGWTKLGKEWYCFDKNGVRKTGWQTKNGNKVYVNPKTGALVTNEFMTIDEMNYYFDSDGAMHTGWLTVNDKQYYFRTNGQMLTGWLQKNGKLYYFRINGEMLTGWLQKSGKLFYFRNNGEMLTGWLQKNGKLFYFRSNGQMLTGWLQKNGKLFYFRSNGQMLTGWLQVNGKKFYFKSNGQMHKGWLGLNGKLYYFKDNGQMVTGRCKIGNKWFTFDKNGVRQ